MATCAFVELLRQRSRLLLWGWLFETIVLVCASSCYFMCAAAWRVVEHLFQIRGSPWGFDRHIHFMLSMYRCVCLTHCFWFVVIHLLWRCARRFDVVMCDGNVIVLWRCSRRFDVTCDGSVIV